ncbi:2730_t:CDS:2 [Dentiscutata erythropus]|uniref:2730_t:CDS:1 n=1 Tax=Dentiscutata erythropus TaxID=1348616 RepID=A0A9N9AZB6_9GLOM|nr:2730_t:CDS:2 [Dentiscutata erythropus]
MLNYPTKKENLPTAIRVPARRITYVSGGSALKPPANRYSVGGNALKPPCKTISSLKFILRTGSLWKGNSNATLSSTSLKSSNRSIPLPRNNSKVNTAPKSRTRATAHKDTQAKLKSNPASLEAFKDKTLKSSNKSIPLPRNNSKVNTAPKSRTCATAHKDTPAKLKSNPTSLEALFKDKAFPSLKSSNRSIPLPQNNSKVNTAPKSRTCATAHKDTPAKIKSNPASLGALSSVSLKSSNRSIPLPRNNSKVNTAPKSRTCATAYKDTQAKFKSNPASLKEILSSKTANDADKKRSHTLFGRGLRPKSTVGTANRVADLSRSRMTYSYRVKKPCDSRMSLYTSALRVPRTNNVKKEPRKSLIPSKDWCEPVSSSPLLEPMRNLTLRRLSRKPITLDDLRLSINNDISFGTKPPNGNHLPTVEEFRLFEELEKLEEQY